MNAQDLDTLNKGLAALKEAHRHFCKLADRDPDVCRLVGPLYELMGLVNLVVEKKTKDAPKKGL